MGAGTPIAPPTTTQRNQFLREVLAGGSSTAGVSALLNPVDVVKTRRQLPGSASALSIARSLWGDGGLAGLARLWRCAASQAHPRQPRRPRLGPHALQNGERTPFAPPAPELQRARRRYSLSPSP